MGGTKICRICGVEKPLNEYQFRNDSNKYRNECKECCNKRSREYRLTHKERCKELNKAYRESHKKELLEYSRIYQKEHLHKFREYNKKARENWTDGQKARANERSRLSRERRKNDPKFREKLKVWNRESALRRRKKITAYEAARKRTDPVFKLKKQIRSEIRMSFNRRGLRKSRHTEDIVGCILGELYWHLLETYALRYGEEYDGEAEVHIDHIGPLSNAHTEDEVARLYRWQNLQLLKAKDNLYKNNKEDYLIRLEDLIDKTANVKNPDRPS